MNKKSLVIQSNRLVEAKYRLSVEEQKIIKILISQIQREDEDFKDYEFHVRELAQMMGIQHKDPYGVLQSITKKLTTKGLEFYDPESRVIIQTAWLSGAKYKIGEGTVILHFDPLLKPVLLRLQSYFTKYELEQILQFKGQYTIRFFEFRRSFLGKNKKEVAFSIKELRDIFGLQPDEYRNFFDFKRRVLESSRLELLEKTGKSFTWEAVRQGKGGKIVAVRFLFDEGGEGEPVARPELLSEPPEGTVTGSELPQPERKPIPTPPPSPSGAVKLLLDCGIAPPVAEELAAAYEEPYIQEKIAILKSHKDWVKSRAGFLVKAIQEDWKDPEQEEQRRGEERRRAELAEMERKKRLRAIRDTFEEYRRNQVKRQYWQFPEATRQKFKAEFFGTLSGVLLEHYNKKQIFDFEDPYYHAFVVQNHFPSLTLEAYLEEVGIVMSPEDLRDIKTV